MLNASNFCRNIKDSNKVILLRLIKEKSNIIHLINTRNHEIRDTESPPQTNQYLRKMK